MNKHLPFVFGWNALLLGLFWVALTSRLSWENFFWGTAIGSGVLIFSRLVMLDWAVQIDRPHNFSWVRFTMNLLRFTLWYLGELFIANINVALLVIRFNPADPTTLNARIIRYPLLAQNSVEIFFLANLISLTPGTLSVDVSSDRRFLFIHAIGVEDPDALIIDIKDRLEHRLITRARGPEKPK